MTNSKRSRAELEFAAAQKKNKSAVKEKERARQAYDAHVANLRALRLAKEAADKASASDKARKPTRLPQTHRR